MSRDFLVRSWIQHLVVCINSRKVYTSLPKSTITFREILPWHTQRSAKYFGFRNGVLDGSMFNWKSENWEVVWTQDIEALSKGKKLGGPCKNKLSRQEEIWRIYYQSDFSPSFLIINRQVNTLAINYLALSSDNHFIQSLIKSILRIQIINIINL